VRSGFRDDGGKEKQVTLLARKNQLFQKGRKANRLTGDLDAQYNAVQMLEKRTKYFIFVLEKRTK
jgi:hypothetical protein